MAAVKGREICTDPQPRPLNRSGQARLTWAESQSGPHHLRRGDVSFFKRTLYLAVSGARPERELTRLPSSAGTAERGRLAEVTAAAGLFSGSRSLPVNGFYGRESIWVNSRP